LGCNISHCSIVTGIPACIIISGVGVAVAVAVGVGVRVGVGASVSEAVGEGVAAASAGWQPLMLMSRSMVPNKKKG
jgi:hypothetical protein